jgi:hypothetical protein
MRREESDTKRSARLMPLILTTQEEEIERIVVPSQPGQMVWETLSQKNTQHKKNWWSGSSGKAPA